MTTINTLYLVLIFLAVSFAVAGVGFVLTRGSGIRGRIENLAGRGRLHELEKGSTEWTETVLKAAQPVANLATSSEEEVTRLRARFMNAGFRQPSAPVIFYAAKTLLVVLFPLVFLVFERTGLLKMQGQLAVASMLIVAAIGYYLPNAVLAAMIRRRQRAIFEALPDAIDLMIVCIEAGLGLDMALNRAAQEMRLRSRELSEELDLITLELRVGGYRDRALQNFALRTGIDEVYSFVAMLLQSDRFGTSIAQSMRVHAEGLRTRRQMIAEEAASKIPLKMLFPLVFFIFPSLLVVLLGPAMVNIYRVMLPAMGGR
jgi:tight adherence protein C